MTANAKDVTRLGVVTLARMIASGSLTSSGLVCALLERVDARDATIKAFTTIDRMALLDEAKLRDRETPRGPLHGVPLGVKDVIDVRGLPTEMGSPLYKGYRPRNDSACAALLRAAGAIILGKTATCEFAGSAPTQTRNPLAHSRTPGGSSSGSAAAVADFMIPAALGTQTGGSILRPASFCGVVGFKPTFGAYSRSGIKLAAESFDTIGVIARSVEDVDSIHCVLANDVSSSVSRGNPRECRIGICRTHLWETVSKDVVQAIDKTIKLLRSCGAQVSEVATPRFMLDLTPARATVNAYERARGLASEWTAAKSKLSQQMIRTCQQGWAVTYLDYIDAQRLIAASRQQVTTLFAGCDLLMTPCTPGEAPEGIDYTGDPRLQEIWSCLHLPTITLPLQCGSSGMPIGIQFVAPSFDDRQLLLTAHWILEHRGCDVASE